MRSATIPRPVVLAGAALLTAAVVWLLHGPLEMHAAILKDLAREQESTVDMRFDSLFVMVDRLLGPALFIVAALAPLGVAWGAGAMMFGGKSGPQIMGASIVAVVLVASAKFVAG
jgi:hypothetical protein